MPFEAAARPIYHENELWMFRATRPFLFFDYFRVPYLVDTDGETPPSALAGWDRLGPVQNEVRSLFWPDLRREGAPESLSPGTYRLDTIPIFGRVVPDATIAELLVDAGDGWHATTPVVDSQGQVVASIWRNDSGSILLPFDPGETIETCWSERYLALHVGSRRAGFKRLALRSYYRLRPFLPRATQIWLRRRFSRIQARVHFPRWPVESGLHDLYRFLLGLAAELAGTAVPHIAAWPDGASWALVLTHDVEQEAGYRNIDRLRDAEAALGYRSSWNFVPRRYDVEDSVVDDLKQAGFEVGVHGLYHDGRDLESLEMLQERLPEIRAHAERWGATGFRSPATHRQWDLMPLLGFDYDSSYPDTDPFEPQAGGCCSLLPFFNRDLVELPITLPQDHTLFVILQRPDESAWVDKALAVRAEGGVAVLITHPDYMLEQALVDVYARFLTRFRDDPELWRALPGEVSDWWRRRAASHLEEAEGGWRIVGPAAEDGTIAFAQPG